MEFNYKVRKDQEFRYLKALIPEDIFMYEDYEIGSERYEGLDDFFKNYPETYEEGYLKLIIDIETGHVVNWPKNNEIDLYAIKVVDSGTYSIMENLDGTGENITYEGYVPKCFGDKYGDYLEFVIDANSNIPGWNFDESDFEEILENAEK